MKNRGKHLPFLEEDLAHVFKVNVIGNIHLFNIIPLIQRCIMKKVIAISTGQSGPGHDSSLMFLVCTRLARRDRARPLRSLRPSLVEKSFSSWLFIQEWLILGISLTQGREHAVSH
ncbi:hypothetical protein BDV11DRAFT_45528 [Aspergillus similis]